MWSFEHPQYFPVFARAPHLLYQDPHRLVGRPFFILSPNFQDIFTDRKVKKVYKFKVNGGAYTYLPQGAPIVAYLVASALPAPLRCVPLSTWEWGGVRGGEGVLG